MRLILRRMGRLALVLALGCGARQERERRPDETGNPEPPETKPATQTSSVTARFKELIAALGSDDGEQRQAARKEIFSSGMKWTDGDMEQLEAATASLDAEVAGLAHGIYTPLLKRRKIAAGLGSLGLEVEDALFGSGEGRLELVKRASKAWKEGKVPGPALSWLAELSVDENWGGLATLEYIAGFGAAELCRTPIVRLCDSDRLSAAAFASLIAERHQFKEAAPGICRSLERIERDDLSNWRWLVEAAAALGVAEDRALVERLSISESAAAREACCDILKRQFRWENADIALRLASDPERSVRYAAIGALCLFGLPDHRDEILRIALRSQLSSGADLEAWRGQFDPNALAASLASENVSDRRSATWLLQWARQPAARLQKAMEDPDGSVRSMAAYAAGRSQMPELVPPLIAMLTDTSIEAADNSAIALGLLKDRSATAPLRAFVKSRPADGRKSGLAGLALLGDPAGIPDVLDAFPLKALNSMEERAAWAACHDLGLVGGSDALQRLRGIEGKEAAVCRLELLTWYGEPDDARLLHAAPPGLVPDRDCIRLCDNLGVLSQNIEPHLRKGLAEWKRRAALNLRLLPTPSPSEELETILSRVSEDAGDDLASVIDTANLALGRSDHETTIRILSTIRASGDPEAAWAIAEALLKTYDPAVWKLWTHEEESTSDICTAREAAAMLEDRGIEIDPATCAPFYGRVAEGQFISPRRLSYRFAGSRCPEFEGNRLQFISPEEALRHWADRLAR